MTDQIDLQAATIVNSPDVKAWPATAAITSMSFGEKGQTRIEFTKRRGPDRWPDIVPAGWEGPLQFTLWLFLKINGQWVGAGIVQFWQNREGSGDSGGPDVPSLYHLNWYYPDRWFPMETHGPIAPGEVIGFMVTSGNARDNQGPMSVHERSNIVTLPATDNGAFTFGGVVVPPVPQPPTPTPPPAGPPYSDALSVDFGQGINAANAVYRSLHGTDIPYDPGMISVHSQRAAFDYYAGGMAWAPCRDKHLNEYRAEYGLPPL